MRLSEGPRRWHNFLRTSAPWRRWSSASALSRTRGLFLLLIALSNLSHIPIALNTDGATTLAKLLVVGGEVWFFLSAVWVRRRGRPYPLLDLADCCALVLMASSGGSSSIMVDVAFPTVFFTSTWGSARRLILRTAGFSFAFVLAMAMSRDFDGRFLPGYIISIVALASVTHLLTDSLNRNGRALVYQRTLASAGIRLVAARSREEVYQAAATSAHELLTNEPRMAAAFVLPSGHELLVVAARGWNADALLDRRFGGPALDLSRTSIRVPSLVRPFADVLLAPLVLGGELFGAIVLASPLTIPEDTEDAVIGLAAETVLSLETLSSSERFRSLVQHSTDVFTIVAPDGSIRYQSPSFARLTGVLPDATIGIPIATLLHPEDAAELTRVLDEHPMPTLQLQLRWRHADGQWRYTETIVSNLLDDPNIKGWTLNTRDLSERARLEMELRQAQKLESIGRLAAGIAHEINTPIQFVGDNLRFLKSSLAELAAERPLIDLEIPLAIDESLEGLERVATIIRGLREFAHPADREAVFADLNTALLSTLTVARGELRSVARVETDLGALPRVRCFPGELNQVFLNLIVNAAHAVSDARRGDQGIIRIVSRCEGDQVVISIEDNGAGIPESIRPRLFDQFFTTKSVGRGTGQGLAVARSIVVDMHHGTLNFSSSVGEGTTFIVRLAIAGAVAARRSVAA